MKALMNFVNDDRGVDLIEYALLAALVGVAAIVVITPLSTSLNALFTSVSTELTAALD